MRMFLNDDREVAATLDKIRGLEDRIRQIEARPVTNPRVRERTLRSLRGVQNQLKEEVLRYWASGGAVGLDQATAWAPVTRMAP